MKFSFRVLMLVVLFSLVLMGCKGKGSPAASAVEGYFKALVAKDANQAVGLSCVAWEENAQIDADTFSINPATLEGLQCKESGKDGDDILVTCIGKMILDYNGEKQEINLADRTYRVIQEGGEWRMCGYK
jgi:hypothetical protein